MIDIVLLRDLAQNKNFILFLIALIFMSGILSCLQAHALISCIILTIFLLGLLYLKIFSVRKIIIFILIFYCGFFLTFCKIKTHDAMLAFVPVNANFSGRIVSIPNTSNPDKIKFFFEVEKINEKAIDKSKTLVTISCSDLPNQNIINIGNKISIDGKLRLPFTATNPSQFDYAKYLRNFNVFTVLYANSDTISAIKDDLPLKWKFLQKLNNMRNYIIQIHSRHLKSPGLEILGGIVFGDDAVAPPDEIRSSFIHSGLLHILAASGMNVAFIFSFTFVILKFCRIPYRPRTIVGMIVVILYTFMTGLGASVVRASLMLLFVMCGKLIDRDAHNVALLSFVAMLMLVYNPAYICDVSFQLSFFVTLGLLTTAKIISEKTDKIPDWIKVPVIIPVVAQIWVAPIQMFYFNTFTLYSVFANILSAPLLSVISFLGFITSLLLLVPNFMEPLCAFVDSGLNYLLIVLVNISNFFGNLKYSLLETSHPSLLQIIIYYIAILLCTIFLKFNKIKHICATIIILLFIPLLSIFPLPSKDLEIIAFDVQNADSFLIKTPQNKYFFIDTGKASYGSKNPQAKIIMLKYLKDRGIKNIEGVIVTHFDNDHSGGTVDILNSTKTKHLYLNSNTQETQTAKNIFETIKNTGQSYFIAENNQEIYSEPNLKIKTYKADIQGKDASNGNSIITLLQYKDFDMLFMGDVGINAFNQVSGGLPQNIEVLKVGHHGGPNVVSKEMITFLNPQVSLISTGINSFGHPNKGTLDILRNTTIIRTDMLHSIKILTDGNGYNIFAYNPHTKKYELKETFKIKK